MGRRPRRDPKGEALRRQGALHPRPETVVDELFREADVISINTDLNATSRGMVNARRTWSSA